MKKPKIDSLFMAAGGSGDSSPISLLRTLRGFAQPSTSLAGRGKRPSPPCFPFSVISLAEPKGGASERVREVRIKRKEATFIAGCKTFHESNRVFLTLLEALNLQLRKHVEYTQFDGFD